MHVSDILDYEWRAIKELDKRTKEFNQQELIWQLKRMREQNMVERKRQKGTTYYRLKSLYEFVDADGTS